jgi:hypothetical protein
VASREETLLFIVDVQVKNARALRELNDDLAAAEDDRARHISALNDSVNQGVNAGPGAAAQTGGGPFAVSNGGNGENGNTQIVGARGRQSPGSRTNPIITAQESGSASGLGSLAAATSSPSSSNQGDSAPNVAAAVPTAPSVPTASPQQGSWLSDAAERVAAKVVQPEDDRVLQAIESISRGNRNAGVNPVLTAAETVRAAQQTSEIADAASMLQRGRGGTRSASPADLLASAQAVQQASSPSQQGLAQQLADVMARRLPAAAPPVTYNSGEAAGRLNRNRSQVRELAATGALPGSYKSNTGEWVIPEDAITHFLAAGGSGAGGGGRPPIRTGGSGSGGGSDFNGGGRGHGSRMQWNPFGGLRSNADQDTDSAFSLANIFKGDGGRGGAFGLPGFGSVGSLAGLGLEHWILSGLGVGASATSAVGGAGLLASSSLTKSLVGGGSDALINHDTITQVETYLSDVTALKAAIAEYGKNSTQAEAAQGALNQSIAAMGGGQAQQGEMQLAKNIESLKEQFNSASNGARAMSSNVMDQVVTLASDYVPEVTSAAQRNLSIINTGLKPLFTWLEGPQGKGIFDSLENSFATTLPTSIHALDMGVEDFLRLMQAALPYTGSLSKDLDNFFTDKNRESAAAYDAEVQKLVGDLREWEALLHLLGEDVGGVFKDDAGTANSIVQSLTHMLEQLHDWEQSSSAQNSLKTVFEVHKQQIDALLNLLPDLAKGYGNFYLDVAPPLVKALTSVAGAIDKILNAVEKLPGGDEFVGLAIVLGKLGVLGPGLKATAGAIGLMTDAEKANAPVSARDAAANAGLDTSLNARGLGTSAKAAEGAEGATTLEEGGEAAGGGVLLSGLFTKLRLGGAAAKISSGAGSAIESGGLSAASAAEGAGFSGLADGLTSAAAAIAPMAASIAPLLVAAGGVAGLVELFRLFSGSSGAYGDQIGKNVANAVGITTSGTSDVAAAANAAQPNTPGTAFTIARVGVIAPASQMTPAQSQKLGQTTGLAFITGMEQVKFPSQLQMFEDMRNTLNAIPAQARGSAAQTMLSYASELQSEGKLPVGSMSTLIQLIERQFPPLEDYLKTHGLTAAQDFANSLSLTHAVTNTQSAVANLKGLFGNIFDNATVTSSNMLSEVTSDYQTLKENMGSLTGQGRQAAQNELSQLRQSATADSTAMAQNVVDKMLVLRNAITSGSASATAEATKNFSAFAQNVATAMSSGTLATSKGTTLIAQALNAELKALGAKPIPLVALKGDTPQELMGEANYLTNGGSGGGAGYSPNGHAGGGLVQVGRAGEKGPDNVLLNVAGTPIKVGAGEKVAVFNSHQEPIMNRALAREGYAGLPGLFSSVKTPHYLASGGFVPGFAGGGMVTGGPQMSYAQLEALWIAAGGPKGVANVAAAIAMAESGGYDQMQQGQPLATTGWGYWQITPGGPQYYNPMTNARQAVADYDGRGFEPWTTYNDGAYQQFLHGNVSPNAAGIGGGTAAQLSSPHVSGGGAQSDITQGALDQVTKAANKVLQAAQATVNATSGAAGTGPGTIMATSGKPANVEAAMMAAASQIIGLPYTYGGGHNGSFAGDPGYDCSGAVSLLLHAGGFLSSPFTAGLDGSIMDWGEPGPGKYITVANWGSSGEDAHTMISFFGKYLESGGPTGQGPHWDSGWDSAIPWQGWRHPAGYATGGNVAGDFGAVPASMLLAHNPGLASNPRFQAYAGKSSTKTGHGGLSTGEQSFLAKHKNGSHKTAPKAKKTKGIGTLGNLGKTIGNTAAGDPIGLNGPFPFKTDDYSQIETLLQAILNLDGTDAGSGSQGGAAGVLADLISNSTDLWEGSQYPTPNFSSWDSPADFVISSTDADGNTTYSISPNINQVATELGQVISWQEGLVGDLNQALSGSNSIQAPISKAIARRTAEVAKIKTRIQDNIKKIKELQAKIKAAQKQIAEAQAKAKAARDNISTAQGQVQYDQQQITYLKQQSLPYPNPKSKYERDANAQFIAKRNGQMVAYQSDIVSEQSKIAGWRAEITGEDAQVGSWRSQISGWNQSADTLKAQNHQLGGTDDAVGTGGELGQIETQLGAPGSSGSISTVLGGTSASGLYQILDTVQGWATGLQGTGGDIPTQVQQLQDYQAALADLMSGATAAIPPPTTSTSSTDTTATPSTAAITGEVGFSFQGQEYVATLAGMPQMAQGGLLAMNALQSLPSWGGSFWTGGTVPGAVGEPKLIEAHGGEIITNPNLPGAGAGTGNLTAAVGALTDALTTHEQSVRANTAAMSQNTSAVSSSTTGGQVRYSATARAYDPSTSSDSVLNARVGL